VQKFVAIMREERRLSIDISSRHKRYLIKQVKGNRACGISVSKLFREIKEQGYRGSIKNVTAFLMIHQRKSSPAIGLDLHKHHSINRLKDTSFQLIPKNTLLKEIKSGEYRGSGRTMNRFLEEAVQKGAPSILESQQDCLIEQNKQKCSASVSGKILFEEIKNAWYRGSLPSRSRMKQNTQRASSSLVQGNTKHDRSEWMRGAHNRLVRGKSTLIDKGGRTGLIPYKCYLRNRIQESGRGLLSTRTLFEEIREKGYVGSIRNVQKFVAIMREERRLSTDMSSRHKRYLIKQVKGNRACGVSVSKLFREIKEQGYRGSIKNVTAFLMIHQRKSSPAIGLDLHKHDSVNRLKDTSFQFKEIKNMGYQGSFKKVQAFLKTIPSKQLPKNAYLDFHKSYLIKRFKETWPRFVSARRLFNNIKAQGYLGSFETVQTFLTKLRKKQIDKGVLKKADLSTFKQGALFNVIN